MTATIITAPFGKARQGGGDAFYQIVDLENKIAAGALDVAEGLEKIRLQARAYSNQMLAGQVQVSVIGILQEQLARGAVNAEIAVNQLNLTAYLFEQSPADEIRPFSREAFVLEKAAPFVVEQAQEWLDWKKSLAGKQKGIDPYCAANALWSMGNKLNVEGRTRLADETTLPLIERLIAEYPQQEKMLRYAQTLVEHDRDNAGVAQIDPYDLKDLG
jgi:hypothetical protein